ncbi:MAG: hypothetical protein ACK5MR_06550 [Cumulibacter sp.]
MKTSPTASTPSRDDAGSSRQADLEQVKLAARNVARQFPPMSGEMVKLVRHILRNRMVK